MTITQQVADLRIEKISHTEISNKLGISVSAVAREIAKAREHGLLEPRKEGSTRNKVNNDIRESGISRGSIQKALERMTPEVRDWVVLNTPEGDEISTLLAAIATDAYHEEMGG